MSTEWHVDNFLVYLLWLGYRWQTTSSCRREGSIMIAVFVWTHAWEKCSNVWSAIAFEAHIWTQTQQVQPTRVPCQCITANCHYNTLQLSKINVFHSLAVDLASTFASGKHLAWPFIHTRVSQLAHGLIVKLSPCPHSHSSLAGQIAASQYVFWQSQTQHSTRVCMYMWVL